VVFPPLSNPEALTQDPFKQALPELSTAARIVYVPETAHVNEVLPLSDNPFALPPVLNL
jgi:hypothetical protein